MSNRLQNSASLYLRQHANNPVDWYPWSEEAFEAARLRDVPVFLSVGYSSCHWCHVMETESFEKEDVAAILNANFVSIKVDREELPDVDEAYMAAVQLSSGRGGWPMSLFLLPDKRPFFAGTYFPRDDHPSGRAGFLSICRQVARLWSENREAVVEQAEEFNRALRETLSRAVAPKSRAWNRQSSLLAFESLASSFDEEYAGFGSAPKFPPHTAVSYLLTLAVTETESAEVQQQALRLAFTTLNRMQNSGIHDQVGGGFHRYSTDRLWHLPHFEKMLYDNALMLSNYARASAIASALAPAYEKPFARTASRIVGWMLRDMRNEDGLLAAAFDADSEGEEGKYYVWSWSELVALLGEEAAKALGAKPQGNFEDESSGAPSGMNILFLSSGATNGIEDDLGTLLKARYDRTQPLRDDKAIVAWNALAVSGLIESGQLDASKGIVRRILQAESEAGQLPHIVANGTAQGAAYLDDYAAFARALFRLAEAEIALGHGDGVEWREEAVRLTYEMVQLFRSADGSAFCASSVKHEELFGRTVPVFDSPVPSANALAIECLMGAGQIGDARSAFQSLLGWLERAPQATEALYEAGLKLLRDGDLEHSAPIRFSFERVERFGQTVRGRIRHSVEPGFHLREPVEFEAAGFTFVNIGQETQFEGAASANRLQIAATFEICTETECAPPETASLTLDLAKQT